MSRRVPPSVLLMFALLAGSAHADGLAAPPAAAWATVNICDTKANPDKIGIRGSIGGPSRRAVLYMRFRIRFQTTTGRWRALQRGGLSDSKWQRVATARGGVHDAGWSFVFEPPRSGGAHVLRGEVRFMWKRRGRVIMRARALTEAGHPRTKGAEPANFSAATCEIA